MKNQTKKIMLLDAYSTRTLACVRSFGAHDIPFVVGGHSRWDMSFSSRYCREFFVYTSPFVSIRRFIADINSNAERYGAGLIFPTSEAAIMACDLHRGELRAELLGPTTGQIETLFHKRKTLALAEAAGVRIPRTVVVDRKNVDRLLQVDVPSPAIIKANTSESVRDGRVIHGGGTWYAYSANELPAMAMKRLESSPEILIQEFINGYGVGVSGIFKDGRPVALFGHRRIRESNPLGGPHAVAVSIPVSGELHRATCAIMSLTGYTGPAMVEYKIDRVSGLPYFMEINARFWGSILLASAAGLDLPYILWKVVTERPVTSAETEYREGVIGRNLLGDTRHLALALKGRPKNWAGYFPGRREALRDYLALFFSGKCRGLLFTRDDPKPAYGRLLQELLT